MRALKDCKWKAEIKQDQKYYWWELTTETLTGLYDFDKITPIWKYCGYVYKNKKSAVRNLKRFVEINGITCDNQNF